MKYVSIVLLFIAVQYASGASVHEKLSGEKNPIKRKAPEPYEVRKNSVGMEFVWIPPGEFVMGGCLSKSELIRTYKDAMLSDGFGTRGWDDGIDAEFPQHLVKLTKGFWMGRHEVTQEQYKTIMGKNPSFFRYRCPHCDNVIDPAVLDENAFSDSAKNHPVESVTWFQALEFCKKLSAKENRMYSLPTEAQWEYACRAGTKTPFSFGTDFTKLGEYSWYDGNSSGVTHRVGQKKPNAWGLFDMHGNVAEWCLDRYDPTFYTGDLRIDPVCKTSIKLETDLRVVRGGSFYDDILCRSASRNYDHNVYIISVPFIVLQRDLIP